VSNNMNPKLSKKEKRLLILADIANNLSKCRIDRNLSNDNNFAGLAVENALWNVKRLIDLL
jgi:hypothetical protein